MTISQSPIPEKTESSANSPFKSGLISKFGKRFGLVAFLFFLAKGLAWIIVPTAVAWAASR